MADPIVIEGKSYVVDPAAQQTVTTYDLLKALAPRLDGPYLVTFFDSAGVLKIGEGKGQLPSGAVPYTFSAGKVKTTTNALSLDEFINDSSELFTKYGVVKITFDKLVPAPATVPAATPPTGGIPTIALLLGGAAVLYFIFRKKD